MAIKILSKAARNNLSVDELLAYENKLRNEVARREARFKSNDRYFKEQSNKYQQSLNERSYSEKFPVRRAGSKEDIDKGIYVLEKTIKSSQSTLKGRKAMLDASFKGFNKNLVDSGNKPISRIKYNRIANFFDQLEDNTDLAAYFYDSSQVIESVNEGLDFETLLETIAKMDEINKEKGYNMKSYSLDMIKEVLNEEEEEKIEKIFEKYSGHTVESNE